MAVFCAYFRFEGHFFVQYVGLNVQILCKAVCRTS